MYKDIQIKKALRMRDSLFNDPGFGFYRNKQYDFVLSDPSLNLWTDIRKEALDYFDSNDITWFVGGDKPTGHLLSSQIACVNHLFFLRQKHDLSTLLLKAVDPLVCSASIIDTGYVEFEKTGSKPLGKEKSKKRGSNSTSIDALMVGEYADGKRILFLIEWKYTESYHNSKNKLLGESGNRRWNAYHALLTDTACPIRFENEEEMKSLFYEPFYQIMRQTLLAWEFINRKEYGVEDWIHLHVIPENNTELKNTITSPLLKYKGDTIETVWKSFLKKPEKYKVIDPRDFIKPLINCQETGTFISYLKNRYWD
jgi:hypothetical protein